MDKLQENKENVTCGCLNFNNKIYPVHEGLNPIGRNPDAIVCLKNLNVSKHHAIITILDSESHYISDYKSFNGTVVNGKKLVPLQLYELQNGASIKFGDVFCTYKKLQGEKIDKVDETQQFSETLFNSNTQQISATNVPEGISIDEMATQVIPPKELLLNDLPTQVFHYSDHDQSSNDSVDFATMQKASNTQNLVNGETHFLKPSSSKIDDSVLKEDLEPSATSTQKTHETDSWEICPVVLHTNKIIDSESEEEPASQVQRVPGNKKNIIDSDSSDTEDDLLEDGKSKYHISDSETDIEDKDISVEHEKSTVDANSPLSQPVKITNEDVLTAEKVKRKTLPQDHLYCQVVGDTQDLTQGVETSIKPSVDKNETVESKELENEKSGAFKELDEEFKFNVNLEKEPDQQKVLGKESGQSNDEVNSVAGEDNFEETPNITSEIETNSQTEEKTKSSISDAMLQPTQTLNYTHDEFLLPTQPLKYQSKEPEPTTTKESSIFDDDFFVPTQAIEKLTKKAAKVDDDFFAPTQPIEKSAKEPEKNDDFLQPTQALENLHGEQGEEPMRKQDYFPENEITTQNLHDIFSDDSLSVSPSETLDRVWSETKVESPAKGKDPFLSPSKQIKSPLARKKPIEQDDSYIIAPTQALEAMHEPEKHFNQVEDQLHEIFASQSLLCTQQLVDVLNMSREDVIEDSMIQEKSVCKKKEKKEVETVVDILAEGLDQDEGLKKFKTADNANGCSNKKEEEVELKPPASRTKSRTRKKQEETEEIKNLEKNNAHDILAEGFKEDEVLKNSKPGDINEDSDKKDSKMESEPSTSKSKSRTRKRKEETEEVKEEVLLKTKTDILAEEFKDEVLKDSKAEDYVDEDFDTNKEKLELKPSTSKFKSRTRNRKEETEKIKGDLQKNNTDDILFEQLDDEVLKKSKTEGNDIEDSDKEEETLELKPTTSRTRSRTRKGNKQSEKVKEDLKKNNADEEADVAKETEKKENEKPSIGENRRGKKKNEDLEEKESKEISVTPGTSKNGIEDTPNRRGRSKKTQVKETAPQDQVDENQGDGPQVQSSKKRSTKGRKEQSQETNVQEPSVTTRKGNKKQDESDDEIIIQDTTKRRGRSRANPTDSDSQPRSTRSTHICADNDSEATNSKETSKGNKRKSEESVAAIPNKKSLITSTPRKRALRAVSNNSEDDFETKVTKTDSRASLRSRKSKAQVVDSDVISVSSSSKTSQSVISISSTATDAEAGKRTRKLSANSKRQLREEEAERKSRNSSVTITSSSSLNTPDRQKRVVKPKVVFTMMDSPELESLIRQLGGNIVDTVHACTVLVTESVKRSQKLLVAIAQGKPICSPQWLQVCKKSYSFVDPWDHILVDKEAEKKWKFSLKESINRGASKKLLENYTFQIIVNNAADVLKGAIEACGGKCVTRNLPKCQTEHLIIISTNENRSKFNKILKQNSKIVVVEPEAIFDGTLRQEFDFSKHQI